MIKWILQDVKRILKSKKSFLLLTMVFLTIINFIASDTRHQLPELPDRVYTPLFDSQADPYKNDSLVNIYTLTHQFNDTCYIDYSQFPEFQYDNDENDCANFKVYKSFLENLLMEDDLEEFYKLKLYVLNASIKDFINYLDEGNPELVALIEEKSIKVDEVKHIIDFVDNELASNYDDLVLKDTNRGLSDYNKRVIDLYETYVNYLNNYPLDVKYTLTSSFFIANYLNDYFFFLIVVMILLIFDSFYRDYKSGVFKNILTVPTNRFRYVITKTSSAIIAITIFVFAPIILTAIILYIYNGYDAINYPVYVSRNTLFTFTPTKEYVRFISADSIYSPITHSRYKDFCELAPVMSFPVDTTDASFNQVYNCIDYFSARSVLMISLTTYITLSISYFFIVIIFVASLSTLLSLTFDSAALNITVLFITLASTNLINQFFIGSKVLKFIPFTFLSPTALLMGTIPYTYLNGVIVLIVSIILLTFINYQILKRKDFAY